ncbi:hypothetical protein GQ600_26911 [Phytophthora cactorum]|nr:hypothetical protein GQ600_26911 [Phytophthora cactorum]
MNYSRSVARALPKPCLPANEYGLSHVLRSIDEYLIPFLCHEVFTAAWHQYTPLTSYFEGPLRYGEKPVVLQCEVAIYMCLTGWPSGMTNAVRGKQTLKMC